MPSRFLIAKAPLNNSCMLLVFIHDVCHRPEACDLDTYLSYMEKVLRAQQYFKTYNMGSKELDDIVSTHVCICVCCFEHDFLEVLISF
jgi:hypothetical protein